MDRGLADIRSDLTDGCLPHTTNTPSHLPARTRNSGLLADASILGAGEKLPHKTPPYFFLGK